MNFNFTVRVQGFGKAAELDAALKDLGLPYAIEVAKKSTGKTVKRQRATITKLEVNAVMVCLSKHPNWSLRDIERECGVSKAVISRIKAGTHPLQLQDKVTKITKAK